MQNPKTQLKRDSLTTCISFYKPDIYDDTSPRALRTSFVEQWNSRSKNEVKQQAEQVRDMIISAIREGRGHELVPFAGQSAGLIHDILLPAGEVVDRIVKEARDALQVATKLL